jgi:cytochrome c-type biogenesis protein CcmF
VHVSRLGDPFADVRPARWTYKVGTKETTTEVAIERGRVLEDVYLVLNGFDERSQQANFTVYLKPFVNFVWMGFGILAMGTAICLLPMGLLGTIKPKHGGAALLILFLGAGSARAAGPHDVVVGGQDNRAEAPAVAQKLYHDLACLCGGCARESLWDCPCGYAAQERERVLALVQGRDLSTPAKQQEAYDAVVAAFAGRHGGQHVLRMPPDSGFNRLLWIVPYLALAGAALVVGVSVRTWVRRGHRQVPAMATAAPAKPPRNDYEDKLDAELDDED